MKSKILSVDRYQEGEDDIVITFDNAEQATKYILEEL